MPDPSMIMMPLSALGLGNDVWLVSIRVASRRGGGPYGGQVLGATASVSKSSYSFIEVLHALTNTDMPPNFPTRRR